MIFAETRPLAQEWSYRFLGAALREVSAADGAASFAQHLTPAGPVPAAPPCPAVVRAWALEQRLVVSDRGRVPASVLEAYLSARS